MTRRSFFNRLSTAVAGCYAAMAVHLFKPSDVLGEAINAVGGNPDYVDAEWHWHIAISPDALRAINVGPPPGPPLKEFVPILFRRAKT